MLLADTSNPAAVRLTGGAMRELMDEMALAGGLAQARPGSIKNLVTALRVRASRRATLLRVDQPSAAHVSKLLDDLDAFFRDYDEVSPTMRVKARQVVTSLNASGPDSPEIILGDRVQRWIDFSGRFSAILHSSGIPDRLALESLVGEFEAFLVDWLTPATSDDYAAIDAMLAHGPPDG